MTTIYLSGPITINPDGYEDEFARAAAELRCRHGFTVINPVELDDPAEAEQHFRDGSPHPQWAAFLRRDIKALMDCDMIAVLPNWLESKGARLEVRVAAELGMPVVWADTLDPVPFVRGSIETRERRAEGFDAADPTTWPPGSILRRERGVELIGLSGYAQSGKDTVGAMLGEHGFQRVAFADKLKELAVELNPNIRGLPMSLQWFVQSEGWDYVKQQFPAARELLQRLGVGAREVFGEDFWVDAALGNLPPGRYVVTDCRFPSEAARIRGMGGTLVRVERPGVGPVNNHESETALDGWEWDHVLRNDGSLEDLRQTVRTLLP